MGGGRVAANTTLNKEPWTKDKGCSSSLKVGRGATKYSDRISDLVEFIGLTA
jgi:hypothetical protein